MSERPNVLILICDQLSALAVGAYGNDFARTPTIDGIAADGTRFEHCFTNAPLCGPSRASFWTGCLPHRTGVTSNAGPPRPHKQIGVHPDLPTLAQHFSDAGYHTVHYGQTYDGDIAQRGMAYVEPAKQTEVEGVEGVEAYQNTRGDRYATDRFLEFMQEQPDDGQQPYLAVLDLWNPHDICSWIGAHAGPHEDGPMAGPLPDLPANHDTPDLDQRPLPVRYACCSHNRAAQAAEWSASNWQHYLAAYHHYLEMVDQELARVLAALQQRADADNTLIVLMADHGEGMAAHRMTTKQVVFYEEIMRVPFIVSGPGVREGGRSLERPLAQLVDLFPTLCGLCDMPAPQHLDGRDLSPWLRGEAPLPPDDDDYAVGEWTTEWGYTWSPGRMIRTPGFTYTHYLEGQGEELYDLGKDPGQMRNLINDPAYAEQLARHRDLLDQHIARTDDPYRSLPVLVDPRWRQHEPGFHNHRGPAAPNWYQTAMKADPPAWES